MAADPARRFPAVAGRGAADMSAVWISRESWQKVWSAIHNIRVRCSHTVKTPCVTLSGSGASARINIDLPGAIAAESAYDGPFAVSYDSETEKLKIKKGFRNVNGEFAEVPDGEAEAAEGTLCLHMEKDAETGELCSSANRLSALPCPPRRISRSRALKVTAKRGALGNTILPSRFSSSQENAFMQ